MNPLTFTPLVADGAFLMQTKQEVVDTENSYYGYAVAGAASSDAKWLIVKISVSGLVTSKQFASLTTEFDKVWDDRATYSYT